MNWAAISLILLAVEAWPACDAAYADPRSRILEVLPSILEQFAGVLPDGATRWLGDKRAIYRGPVRNPRVFRSLRCHRRGRYRPG